MSAAINMLFSYWVRLSTLTPADCIKRDFELLVSLSELWRSSHLRVRYI